MLSDQWSWHITRCRSRTGLCVQKSTNIKSLLLRIYSPDSSSLVFPKAGTGVHTEDHLPGQSHWWTHHRTQTASGIRPLEEVCFPHLTSGRSGKYLRHNLSAYNTCLAPQGLHQFTSRHQITNSCAYLFQKGGAHGVNSGYWQYVANLLGWVLRLQERCSTERFKPTHEYSEIRLQTFS